MKHEEKHCPRCKALFECKVGAVDTCHCSAVKLTDSEQRYLSGCFADCLCAKCINDLRSEFHFREKKRMLDYLLRK